MSEHGTPRDVPPPRPVEGEVLGGGSGAEPGLGAAARALADAVAGLLGREPGGPAGAPGPSGDGADRSGSAGKVLADVIAAVAGAARAGTGAGRSAGRGGGKNGRGLAPGGLLTDLLDAAAPRLPIRGRERLRAAYPGASDEQIADALTARAARLTGGIGAASGGLAAAQWFTPPTLLAMPLELGAQTVLVAAVEVVLIGELHELYGRRPSGDARDRATAYLAGWSAQRSVDGAGVAGLGSVLSGAAARGLQRRVTRRLAGAVPTAAPLLVGAAVAGRINRRATEKLADRVLEDLRATPPPPTGT